MIPTYNIAFIPENNRDIFIQYAQKFSSEAHHYLLGENSNPHVTLCHFQAEEYKLSAIWEEAVVIYSESILLTFNHLRAKSYDKAKYGDEKLHWISLIPQQKAVLKKVHVKVATLIQQPLNSAFEHYDPHLTLCNSFKKIPLTQPSPITEKFILALGLSDNSGQLIKILYTAKQAF